MGDKFNQATYFVRDMSDVPDCCYTCVWLNYSEGEDQDYCNDAGGNILGMCKNFVREHLNSEEISQ